MNRDRESRPRLGSDASFFGDSFSNLEIDDNVRILHNLGLDLAANISTALAFQHDREREDNIMIFLKCLELLVSVETLRHVASRCEFENVLRGGGGGGGPPPVEWWVGSWHPELFSVPFGRAPSTKGGDRRELVRRLARGVKVKV
jgi:hypothetical protein